MLSNIVINSYEEFTKYMEDLEGKQGDVLMHFTGSKLPSGDSWCPDCVEAEPVIKAFLSELTKNVTYVYVDVGDREYWKNKECPFRTDPRCRLMVIPTIIRWKGVQRLEGSQCGKRDLLQLLFEDED